MNTAANVPQKNYCSKYLKARTKKSQDKLTLA